MTEEIFQKTIVNCETNEQQIVPLTDEEIAEMLAAREEAKQRQALEEAQAQAKAEAKASAIAKLAALGLTEEEAAAIAGA